MRNLKKLKSLDIFSGRVTDLGCEYLSHITTLEGVELCGGGVGDVSVFCLFGIPYFDICT